jgi:hypothetical protein
VKLKDFHCARPTYHPHTPGSPQAFTVGVRGVTAIESFDGGAIVTLVPGDGDERSKGNKPVRLFVTPGGVGEVAE